MVPAAAAAEELGAALGDIAFAEIHSLVQHKAKNIRKVTAVRRMRTEYLPMR